MNSRVSIPQRLSKRDFKRRAKALFYLYILKNGDKGVLDIPSAEKWQEVTEGTQSWSNPITVSYLYSANGEMQGKRIGGKVIIFGSSL